MIQVTVPGIPPSVNHYKGVNRRTGRFFVRKPAIAFKADVALMLQGQQMPRAKSYHVKATIYLGKGQRGDVDNFAKVLLDALQAAGAIPSDSRIGILQIVKRRDPNQPRTEITIEVLDQKGTK